MSNATIATNLTLMDRRSTRAEDQQAHTLSSLSMMSINSSSVTTDNEGNNNLDASDGGPHITLDFDCLTTVMPHIQGRRDLLAFISTCSALYTPGIPALLHLPYTINEANLQGFHAFLLSKAPTSFLALRDLTFALNTLTSNDATLTQAQIAMLSDVFVRATALQSLRLTSAVLCQRASIPNSIASLTTLRRLAVNGAFCTRTIWVLVKLQSPLEALEFILAPWMTDPRPLLARFQRTLREASLRGSRYLITRGRFPNLRTLDLRPCSSPAALALALAFPNLDVLVLGSMSSVRFSADIATLRAQRKVNIQAQKKATSVTWRLSSIAADVGSLFALGLQYEVPYVMITDYCPAQYSYHVLNELREMLVPLKPRHLHLVGFTNPSGDVTNLSRIFRERGGIDTVKRLDLTLDFTPDAVDPDPLMDTLNRELNLRSSPALRESGIFMLSCTFRFKQLSHDGRGTVQRLYNEMASGSLAGDIGVRQASLSFVEFKLQIPSGTRQSCCTFDNSRRPNIIPAKHGWLKQDLDTMFELVRKERVTAEAFTDFMLEFIRSNIGQFGPYSHAMPAQS